jgi:hypothetical protein
MRTATIVFPLPERARRDVQKTRRLGVGAAPFLQPVVKIDRLPTHVPLQLALPPLAGRAATFGRGSLGDGHVDHLPHQFQMFVLSAALAESKAFALANLVTVGHPFLDLGLGRLPHRDVYARLFTCLERHFLHQPGRARRFGRAGVFFSGSASVCSSRWTTSSG